MIPEIKTILYATDLSKNSSYALFYAVDMARRHNARIVILHSVEPFPHLYRDGGFFRVKQRFEEVLEQQKTEVEEIKKRLQDFCKTVETQTGPPCVGLVSKVLVPLGHPAEEILNAADEENCDAIVLGTHGKGFLKQTFLGSVATSVLERTRKPVFIIPLPAEETKITWDSV